MTSIERLHRLQVLVAAEADASWLDFAPPRLIDWARGSRVGLQLLSQMLARRATLRLDQPLTLASEQHWLLDGAAAVRALAHGLGAHAWAPVARRQIARSQVQRWQLALAPHHALLTRITPALLRTPLPPPQAAASEDWRAHVLQLGQSVLRALLDSLALRARLALMFPRTSPSATVLVLDLATLDRDATLAALTDLRAAASEGTT